MRLCVFWFGLLIASRLIGAVEVSDFRFNGTIVEETLECELAFTARTSQDGEVLDLLAHDVALVQVPAGDGWHVALDAKRERYVLVVEEAGRQVSVNVTAVCRFSPHAERGETVRLQLPAAPTRQVFIQASQPDVLLNLAHALGIVRETTGGQATIRGYLEPQAPLVLQKVLRVAQEKDAELLAACEVNAIATVSPGILRVDTALRYTVNQGALRELTVAVPSGVTITQLHGPYIRDWRLGATDEGQQLIVQLNQDQTGHYLLQVIMERSLETLPTQVDVPALIPLGVTRVEGAVAIGTQSAIQIQVQNTTGLSQVDVTAFPRLPGHEDASRTLPGNALFCYTFAAAPYQLQAAFSDVVPAIDVENWLIVQVEDDDLTIQARLQLDVRDAPIRRLTLGLPEGFLVANVTGSQVADYAVTGDAPARQLVIELSEPVSGQVLLECRLEWGRSPLGQAVDLSGLAVVGARNERGFLTVVTAQGVWVEEPQPAGMRTVHTRSLPVRVANAQYAWRFRQPGWQLVLPVKSRPAAIRAEAFQLISFGDGVAYGTIAVSYFIAGAPVDRLHFRVDDSLENVEFVGVDVTRWEEVDGIHQVYLRRKVIGDYNLGVTYTKRYSSGDAVRAGGVEMAGVETQNGFVVAASHLNMQLGESNIAEALIPIGVDELPEHYRLLVSAPILRTWKYVRVPHGIDLAPQLYARGDTPAVLAEFIAARTELSITPAHEAESVTRVRYTIKNSSAQFLDLQVPAGIKVWSTRLIDTENGGQEQRLTAAREGDLLKVPLPRQRNPNVPLTIEVEFGQLHGQLGWSGELRLALPPSPVHATFADWEVVAPQGWALQPRSDGRVMGLSNDRAPRQTLLVLGRQLVDAWLEAGLALAVIPLALVVLLLLAMVVRRRVFTQLVLLVISVGLAVLGLAAWTTLSIPGGPTPSLTYSQVLNLSPELPLSVALAAVPAWRWQLDLIPLLVLLVITGAGIYGWRRGGRFAKLSLGVAVAGLCGLLLQVPIGGTILAALATFGLPALLFVATVGRLIRRQRAATASAIVLVLLGMGLATDLRAQDMAVGIDAVTAQVLIGDDSAEVTLQLRHQGARAFTLPLPGENLIMLEQPAGWGMRADQAFVLVPAGAYSATMRFLVPLAGPWAVTIPLPPALSRQVQLTVPASNLTVQAEGAIRLTTRQAENQTVVDILYPPDVPIRLQWQPETRRVEEGQTVFYAETTTLARADNGLIESDSLVRLRIAQGQLRELALQVPPEQTVTRVLAASLASWRFNPDTHMLTIQLQEPVTGECHLFLSTQIPAGAMPYEAALRRPTISGAERQRGSLGLANSASVFSTVLQHPRAVNLDDFNRDAELLLQQLPGLDGADVTQAWRQTEPDDVLTIRVDAVLPELRLTEAASLSIGDDMVVYSSELKVSIAKAGVFSLDLLVPDAFDVETLVGPAVSHWDERPADQQRRLRVHFKQQFQGETNLSLALSMAADGLPDRFDVPRVTVVDALKHNGQLIVSTARGIRLAVRERQGVSELDVARLGMSEKPALAFKLLRPDWHLSLEREQVEPRTNVEFLHVGTVSDGLIRHLHYLRFKSQNAGLRAFTIIVPENALGLQITGPEIARQVEVEGQPGHWRIELTGKWFDRAYPLQVAYETRYRPEDATLQFLPVRALDTDLEQGYLVVKTSNRVEVSVGELGQVLQPAEARTIPAGFGAGDLADAAFCYSTNTGDYAATFQAIRHTAADLLAAEVTATDLTTVVSRHGDAITQVKLQLLAGGKRHLQATLPADAEIWSLLVDRQARTPSRSGTGQLLIPLPQTTGTDLTVAVELIYVQPRQEVGQRHDGPRFDLPLKNITWTFYLPEEWTYHDFGGTLTIDEEEVEQAEVKDYSLDAYRNLTSWSIRQDLQKAVELQNKGQELAQQGEQQAARQAYEQAYNYSFNDQALNEDARVNLRRLVEQQAMVGLVSRRSGVRQGQTTAGTQQDARFTANDAERIQGGLSKQDSENLERIVNRMNDMQEAAADLAVQLMVNLPQRGRQLVFQRPLQVEPEAEMVVSFEAWQKPGTHQAGNWLGLVILALVVAGALAVWPFLRRGIEIYHQRPPEPPVEPDPPTAEQDEEVAS